MSLKHFHLLFIAAALIITAGFGWWALREYAAAQNFLTLLLGLFSLASAAGLTAYLFWFIRKSKTLPS